MKWDIDRALRGLEPEILPGTTVSRVLVATNLIEGQYTRKNDFGKIKLTSEERANKESIHLWCLALGHSHTAKAFFYGRTIRECYLRAIKAAKLGALAFHTPWGRQDFKPNVEKAKPKAKKRTTAA